jgi:hypothetical protein
VEISLSGALKTPKVPYSEKTIKTPQNAKSDEIGISGQESVENYVVKEAKKEGVNENIVTWIVGHESQFGKRVVGDDGISLGVWQFNIKTNPGISRECAMDLKCSTQLALNWLKAGKINKWSTWKFRCKWYQDAPDCN